MEKQWMKIPEAAEYLGVSETSIYRWIRAGKLPGYKAEGITRLKKSDLDNFLESGKTN